MEDKPFDEQTMRDVARIYLQGMFDMDDTAPAVTDENIEKLLAAMNSDSGNWMHENYQQFLRDIGVNQDG